MKMLRKIMDGKSLEISQENVYEGVSFSKVTNLQCSDCNFAIKLAHHRYFLEYVPKTNCLKEKSLWWTNFLIKLQPCSTQPSVYEKNGIYVNLPVEALKILIYSQVNAFGGGFFSLKMQAYSLSQQFH